ncbi:probable xyloglucan endotransglucosylase/hydrolase protein 30 [Tanacetum coccineum]
MSSYTHPSIPSDYDVEDAFSSTNAPNYTPTSPNYSRDFFPPEDISLPKDSETPIESPIPISLSSSVGSSSLVRSTTPPPPDYPFDESIFAELDNSLLIIPRPLGSEPVPNEPDESYTCYNMPPKRTSTSETPTMTQVAIRQLIADGIDATLEAQAATMCVEEDRVTFATGTLIDYALSWWNAYAQPIRIEQANMITWTELKRLLTNKYCPQTEVKKMEDKFYNLAVKGNDLKTYVRRFQELAVLCPNMVPNTEKLMEVFIRGLPESIKGNVTASKPQILEEAITITQRLIEQVIKTILRKKPMITNESLRIEETPPTTTTPMTATTITTPTITTMTTIKITTTITTVIMITTNSRIEGKKLSELMLPPQLKQKVHISRLNPFGYAKLTTFVVMCKAYGCEPPIELFHGFFNLFRGGKWLTFAKRPEKSIPHLFPKVITRIEEMAFRNFVYAEDEEDLSFLPNEPSLGFGTGSPSVSVNIESLRVNEKPVLQPADVTADSGGSPKPEFFVVHPRSVAARIKDRKCKTMRGSSRPPMNRKLASGSLNSRATRAKTFTSKDDVPFLTVSDDDEGLSDVPELKDATACHLKIYSITPPTWKNHLDNHMDVELLDLHDRCYARQAVVDNAMYKRSREFLEASLLTLESQIASIEAEKARLEAFEVSIQKEVDDVKQDRMDVVSKVVPYAAMKLIYNDDLGSLVGRLVSFAIFYGRCKAFEQVAGMKEPFELSKVKGYRPSYKKEHNQASNDLATATFPWLSPSKTQALVASSPKATPSSVLGSNPTSPPVDAFVVKPLSSQAK